MCISAEGLLWGTRGATKTLILLGTMIGTLCAFTLTAHRMARGSYVPHVEARPELSVTTDTDS